MSKFIRENRYLVLKNKDNHFVIVDKSEIFKLLNENEVRNSKPKIDLAIKKEILKRLRLELSWLDDKKESFDEACKSKLEAIKIISNLPVEEN